MNKKPSPAQLAEKQNKIGGSYITFGDTPSSRSKALANYGNVVDTFDNRIKSSYVSPLTDVVDNVNVRKEFTRDDYRFFRPSEALPTKFDKIISLIRSVYKRNGTVRNVIDLMSDFACENFKFLHPNKETEIFYNVWRRKVNLNEKVNQFAKLLLRENNLAVKRITAKISVPVQRDMVSKADPDIKVPVPRNSIQKREIPWKYKFLDITKLSWSLGETGLFSDSDTLMFQIPRSISKMIANPKTPAQKEAVSKLPNDFVARVKKGNVTAIPLDMEKVSVFFGKKDDWEAWACPYLYAVLSDIQFKEKLRQAEISALDGVINVIRLWKLGDHKEGFLPDQEAVDRLINILDSNTGGGAMDIVWDSLIEMQDFYPPVDKILGSEKYEQVNKDILIGLGIPEVLMGGRGGNFSNSFIQLKTVIEKLEYVREKIREWLEEEVKLVAEAMGFDKVPVVYFSHMNLQDEAVEKKLVLGLLDRGILSTEAVLDVYGQDFMIEMSRIPNEQDLFEKNNIELKGPFDSKDTLGGDSGGRPVKTKDETTRKDRQAKPKSSYLLDGLRILDQFDKIVVPAYMEEYGIDNARKLTNKDNKILTQMRIKVLSCINSMDNFDISKSLAEISKYDKDLYQYIMNARKIAHYNNKNEEKIIEAQAWSTYMENCK